MDVYKATRTSRRKIKNSVYELMRYVKAIDKPNFSMLKFFENYMEKLLPGFVLQVVEDYELDGLEGMAFPDERTIIIPNRVYYGAAKLRYNDIFTLCHESGHLFMHINSNISYERLENGQILNKQDDPEWQADVFAKELLKALVNEFGK